MLENSNLIDGQNAKRVNELIAEYEDIKIKANDLETSKKKVLAELFELAEIGVNETNKYIFKKNDNKGRLNVSAKKLQEQAPELFGQVSDLGLVTVGDNYFTITGIKLKGDRA